MQVFISWSGDRSKHIALSFKSWLSSVIQSLEPWVSPDIEKGTSWIETLSGKLESAKIGIICLTKDNLNAPWILFESGALSKSKADLVCTFLYDVRPVDVKYPLAKFQHTENNKEDIFKLVTTINDLSQKVDEKKLSDEALKKSFETYWGQLSDELSKTPKADALQGVAQRSTDDMLREVLGTVRNLQTAVQDLRAGMRASLNAQNIFSQAIQRDELIDNLVTSRRRPSIGAFEGPRGSEMVDNPSGLNGPSGPDPGMAKETGASGAVEEEPGDFADGPPRGK